MEPNQGIRRAYRKKLTKLKSDFQRYVLEQILLDLDDTGMLAQDASLSNPKDPATRAKVKALQRKILSAMARQDPQWLRDHINEFVTRHLTVWQAGLGKAALQLSTWFVRNQLSSITNAQKRALQAAGFNMNALKRGWSIPFVKKQFISPQTAQALPKLIGENAALITKISLTDVQRISDVIAEGLAGGDDLTKLRKTLSETDGFDAKRVETVVNDQTNKISNQVQISNAQGLGIKYGIWKHVPGLYTSRQTHKNMDGKKFDLSVGLWDEDVQKNVIPGECINCKCIWRMALPDWLSKDDEND